MILPFLLAAICPFAPNAGAGFYQWSSTKPAEVLHETAEKLHELRAGLVRLYVGPRYDYVHRVLAPDRARRTPVEAIGQPQLRTILEDPCLPTVVLSVYPGRDYGAGLDDINLNRPWGSAEALAETSQLLAFADGLYEMIGDLDKTVIIANSEADARLLEIANYTGSLPLAIANITAWQRARYQAVARARLRHPYARLRLLNAFEVSYVNLGIEQAGDHFAATPDGGTNALRAIVPNVPFDLLSYSAYETVNGPYQTGAVDTPPADIGVRLRRDMAVLRRAAKRPVMIGEFGFSRGQFDGLSTGGVAPRMAAAFAALEKARPAYVVLWQAFDGLLPDGAPDGFGLLEPGSTAVEPIKSFVSRYGAK